jgi:hypothetical protein
MASGSSPEGMGRSRPNVNRPFPTEQASAHADRVPCREGRQAPYQAPDGASGGPPAPRGGGRSRARALPRRRLRWLVRRQVHSLPRRSAPPASVGAGGRAPVRPRPGRARPSLVPDPRVPHGPLLLHAHHPHTSTHARTTRAAARVRARRAARAPRRPSAGADHRAGSSARSSSSRVMRPRSVTSRRRRGPWRARPSPPRWPARSR